MGSWLVAQELCKYHLSLEWVHFLTKCKEYVMKGIMLKWQNYFAIYKTNLAIYRTGINLLYILQRMAILIKTLMWVHWNPVPVAWSLYHHY